jgi:hypothetical protein
MIESYEDILATELAGPDDLKGYLAAAPYTLHPTEGFVSMKQLEELECLLRHFPTGPVRETIRLLGQDRQKAAERWGRLREVWMTTPNRKPPGEMPPTHWEAVSKRYGSFTKLVKNHVHRFLMPGFSDEHTSGSKSTRVNGQLLSC